MFVESHEDAIQNGKGSKSGSQNEKYRGPNRNFIGSQLPHPHTNPSYSLGLDASL